MRIVHHLCFSLCLSFVLLSGFSDTAQAQIRETIVYPTRGHLPDLKFSLNRVGGTYGDADLKGKVALLFFGYASCPDICPTTMAELTSLLSDFTPQQAEQIQIVFISVDPHRDTPEVLQAYVDAFENGAIGVTGNAEQIADIARRYRVAYQIEKPKPGADINNYEVMHAQGVYIFDQNGKASLLATDASNTKLLHDKILPLLK